MKQSLSNIGQWIRSCIHGLLAPVRSCGDKKCPAINLDNAATTPPFKQVICEIEKQMKWYGSIGRGKGQKSEHSTRIYMEGRELVKKFVGAQRDDYTAFYVNTTTEGINKLASALVTKDDIVVSTRMEHHANDLPWRMRCRTLYAEVLPDGRLNVDDLERLLKTYPVKIVTVTAASNVTGYINDVHKIARIAHQYGALIVVDGAQIVAHRAFNMIDGSDPLGNIDFFAFSAHKMYSPFGGGAVVGRKDILDQHVPHFYGGGMVETVNDESVCFLEAPDVYEAGSPNYPGVVGMLEAIRILDRIGFNYITQHEQNLMRKTIAGLRSIPGITLYGDNDRIADRVGIVIFNIDGYTPEETSELLATYSGIASRHAAFCAHPYIRRLLHEPEDGCQHPVGMVRISFGVYTSEAEIDCLIKTVRKIATGKNLKQAPTDRLASNALSTKGVPYDRG